jgi:uncharacterized Zn finger protein
MEVKMRKHNHYIVVLLIVLLFAVSLACGGSNEGTILTPESRETTNSDEVQSSEEPSAEQTTTEEEQSSSSPKLETYQVGDIVEIKDHTIRLNSVKYQGNVLAANFTIVNLGASDLSISSMLSFSAKKSDGTKLDQEIFDCGTSGLDGKILPGDKLTGDICWSGTSPENGNRLYYEASLFGSGAVVWDAIEGEAEPMDIDAGPAMEVFAVGDIVEVKDHTIRVNSIEFQPPILRANISIENNGDSDLNVSSMISFLAKKGDGTKLELEVFNCGTSSLDGKVLPGDRLRGDICWSGANVEDNIKIYYDATLFGEGAVVWDAIPGEAEPESTTDAVLKVNTYNPGDIVNVQDQNIVLNNLEIQGNVLKGNFTIENLGTSELAISSALLFSARKRDGTNLEQEIFSCGTSFDGQILPGDKLTGDVCWTGANIDDGIKIYYDATLIGEGAIVWLVK